MEIGRGQKREREWAAVAWLSPGLGWGIYTASPRRRATVYATQRRSEREKKKKKRFEVQCCRRQTTRCRMQKGSPVIKGEAKMYGISMRDSGRRVEREWQGSVSDGKGVK